MRYLNEILNSSNTSLPPPAGPTRLSHLHSCGGVYTISGGCGGHPCTVSGMLCQGCTCLVIVARIFVNEGVTEQKRGEEIDKIGKKVGEEPTASVVESIE